MVSELVISTVLQASITGAGLVLAIYGIIIPVFGKIMHYRVNTLTNLIKQIKEKPAKDFLLKKESIEEAKNSLDYIDEMRKLPLYFRGAVILSFLGYIFSSLFCLLWFLDWNKSTMEQWIPWLFGVASVLFGYIGYRIIRDLIGLIKTKYENLLKKSADDIDKTKRR